SKDASSTPTSENDSNQARPNLCGPGFNCGASTSQNCQSLIERYEENTRRGLEPLEKTNDEDDHQTLKHIVLLIILLCSMFVGLAVSIWTLVMEGMSGIYLELSFLDAFLNFGQSLIVMAVFIGDSGELLMPVIKIWRKIWYGANVVTLIGHKLVKKLNIYVNSFVITIWRIVRRILLKTEGNFIIMRLWRIRTYRKVSVLWL
ncbi:hypothetical protein DOY81_014920, partial [Sarcophaga bullata]